MDFMHRLERKLVGIIITKSNVRPLNQTNLNHSRSLLNLGLLCRRLRLSLRCRSCRGGERLLKVGNDVVNVLRSDRDADEVLVLSALPLSHVNHLSCSPQRHPSFPSPRRTAARAWWTTGE